MNTQDHKIAFGDGIKALDAHGKRYGGYLVHFNTPDESDLHGERFIADTNFMLKTHPLQGKPVLFHHGLDDSIGAVPLGKIDTVRKDAKGIYIEFNYKFAENYREYMQELGDFGEWSKEQDELLAQYEDYIAKRLQNKVYKFSSGALPSGVKTADDGTILQWPMIEGSATPTPAEQRGRTVISAKALLPHLQHFSVLQAKHEVVQHQTEDDPDAPMHTVMPDGQPDIQNSPSGHSSTEAKSLESDTVSTKQEGIKMDREELFALFREFLAEVGIEAPAEEDMEAMAAATEEMVSEDEEEQKAISIDDVRNLLDERFDDVASKFAQIIEQNEAARKAARKDKFEEARAAERQKAAIAKGQPESKVNPYHNPNGANIRVSENMKYAHLSAEEMAAGFLYIKNSLPKALRNTPMANQVVSEDYFRHMVHKVNDQAKSGFKDIKDTMAVKAAMPWKSDEIDASNISGQGSDWVGTYYGTTLWETARNEIFLLNEMRSRGLFEQEIPQGASSVPIPTEGSDPIAYTAGEANDLDATGRVEVTAKINAFGTGSVTLTPGMIKIAAAASQELVEDSVIPVLPNMTRQINIAALETIEKALINADSATGATTNINLIDGTPATGLSKPYYLATNGLRKYPLVTNTNYARSAGGSLKIDDFRLLLKLFTNKVRSRKQQLFFLIDGDTHNTALALPELATDDVRRTNATITSGVITNIYGVDVFETGFLELANNAGKIPAAGGTLGQILAVYSPYWAFGWKREVTLETGTDLLSGATIAVCSMRFGMVPRGADAAAETYNVGIS